jgi:hypothetical protein
VPIALKRQLLAAVGRAHPGALHPDAAAAERDLTGLVPVPDGETVGVVLAARADDLVDLGLQQLAQHAQPDADAEREQALLRRAGELAERVTHPLGQPPEAVATDVVGGVVYVLHRGLLLRLDGLGSHPPRSQRDRTRREDRHLKFYELRDNLASALT